MRMIALSFQVIETRWDNFGEPQIDFLANDRAFDILIVRVTENKSIAALTDADPFRRCRHAPAGMIIAEFSLTVERCMRTKPVTPQATISWALDDRFTFQRVTFR